MVSLKNVIFDRTGSSLLCMGLLWLWQAGALIILAGGLLNTVASLVVAHGLRGAGSAVVAHGLSAPGLRWWRTGSGAQVQRWWRTGSEAQVQQWWCTGSGHLG